MILRSRLHKLIATDYRAGMLEAIATTPNPGSTTASIVHDVLAMYPEYKEENVKKMIWQLRKEGLIGRGNDSIPDDTEHFFITQAGLRYLTSTGFGKLPPSEHIRPGARHKKKPKTKETK